MTVVVNRWDSPSPRHELDRGVDVISYRLRSPYDPKRPISGFLGWMLFLVPQLRALARLIKKYEIDVIQLRYPGSYQIAFRLLRIFGGPPYAVSLHGNDVLLHQRMTRLDRLLIRWVLAGASQITAGSQSLAAEAEEVFPNMGSIGVIMNGKPIKAFDAFRDRQSRAEPSNNLPRLFFVNAANVTWKKGQDSLIRAWAQLLEAHPNIHLFIAGEKRDLWDECVRLIDNLDCGHRVHLLGPLLQPELFSLMARATGCILPSRHEGGFGAILEAGCLRLPVICSDIPLFREIARDGENALVFPCDDQAAMKMSVARLVSDQDLQRRLGDALYADVRRCFQVDVMADRFLAMYRGMVRRDRHRLRSLPLLWAPRHK